MKNPTIILTLLALSGCTSQLDALRNVGNPPPLENVAMPMDKPTYKPIEWEPDEEEETKQYSGSLWKTDSSTFFQDKKARKIGDILKVIVQVKDKATIDNETERKREGDEKTGIPHVFGLEEKLVGMIPGGVPDVNNLIGFNSEHNTKGSGSIDRQEVVETEVAAMVTQILPNGNLVIHGDQEIRVNFEVRKITVDGIARPEDINANNSIDSNQIAEARISYGGRGQITNMQQPRLGHQVIDILSPF